MALLITKLRKVYCWVWEWNFFKSVNIWQSYKQKRDCLVHFLRLLAVFWPGAQSARDNHVLASNTHTRLTALFSGTTQMSRYQKGETNLYFTGARDSEWQWHQLGNMQVCTSLQTDNHASTSLLSFFTGRMPFLPLNQQCQSTEGKRSC